MDETIASAAPALEAKIGAFRKKHRLPGIVAGIADRDGLRWWKATGFADIDAGRRPDDQTLYRVASISKTITATAVLQLRDEGRLRLDDPAVRFIPELARAADPHGPIEDVTIRRLLQHTSGLQGEVPWQDHERIWLYRPEELLAVLDRVRVVTPPETDHKYSNLAFELLGIVVERVAGRPYEAYVRASILDPLGMTDTVLDPGGERTPRKAVGYDARGHSDRLDPATDFASGLFMADGGWWSTAADLGRWIAQQLRADPGVERGEGQVLRGATLAEMHRPTFVSKPDLTEGQGLGWYVKRSGETVLVQHSGLLWGFTSNVSFSPAAEVGAVVLVNGIAAPADLARELVEAILPALREAEDRAEVAAAAPMPDAYRELVGAYRDPELGDDAVVEWRDGKLMLLEDRPGVPHHELVPTDDPLTFTILGGRPGGEPIVFIRGEDGRVERCHVSGYPAIRVDLRRSPTWR